MCYCVYVIQAFLCLVTSIFGKDKEVLSPVWSAFDNLKILSLPRDLYGSYTESSTYFFPQSPVLAHFHVQI